MTRTTLEIDPTVLAAARARARARGTTIGSEVSALARAGLASESARPVARKRLRGLTLAPSVPGHVITDEMVADADEDI
jgi:hypothetical protein